MVRPGVAVAKALAGKLEFALKIYPNIKNKYSVDTLMLAQTYWVNKYIEDKGFTML